MIMETSHLADAQKGLVNIYTDMITILQPHSPQASFQLEFECHKCWNDTICKNCSKLTFFLDQDNFIIANFEKLNWSKSHSILKQFAPISGWIRQRNFKYSPFPENFPRDYWTIVPDLNGNFLYIMTGNDYVTGETTDAIFFDPNTYNTDNELPLPIFRMTETSGKFEAIPEMYDTLFLDCETKKCYLYVFKHFNYLRIDLEKEVDMKVH